MIVPIKNARLKIIGQVQGVFYRHSTRELARRLGLTGWVANLSDGSVQAEVQGPENKIHDLISWCQSGPPSARVTEIKIEWLEALTNFKDFEIR